MDSFDAIVYGNDISSLITALFILKKDKRVLLVDPNNRVGNFTDSIIKHRFTFNNMPNTLIFNPNNKKDLVNKMIKELNIDTEFVSSPDLFHIIAINKDNNNKKEYTLPLSQENFITKIEEYVPNSKESVIDFFSLAEECYNALNYIIENTWDEREIKNIFPNFIKLINKSVSEVLDQFKMPIAAQEIINSCWIYFSSPETELSFIDYASFMYNLVNNNVQVPEEGMEEFSFKIFKEYLNNGGNYINNLPLNKIITLDREVTGVLLDNEIYYTSNFITSLNPNKVYNTYLEKNEIPKGALQLCNKRTYDGSPFTIFLGLNRTPKEIGLDSFKYLIYTNLDSDVEYNKMSNINNTNSIVTIQNNIKSNVSPKGTTIMTIESYFFNNIFEDYVSYDTYPSNVDDITNNLITSFEERIGLRIRDYIEEMVVLTPVDYQRKYLDASYFGYKLKPLDNTIMRFINYEEEEYIKGLYFCGKYGIMGGTANNMLLSSRFIAERVAKR